MKRPLLILCAAAAALVAFKAAPEPPKIGVVDMSRLIRDNKQSKEEQGSIVQWQTESDRFFTDKRKHYEAEVAELDQMKEGTDEYRRKVVDLKGKKSQLEIEDGARKEEYDRKVARSLVDAHARVTAACRKFCDEHDLDLVLQYTTSPVEGTKRDTVVPEIVVRTVVAFRKTIDVTEGVLALLDAGK